MKKICEADFCNGAASPGAQEVYHTPVPPQRRNLFSFLISVFLVSVFAFLAAVPLVFRRTCEINLLTVLAHAQGIVFICQHERKCQMDTLVQGMEVPPECGLVP